MHGRDEDSTDQPDDDEPDDAGRGPLRNLSQRQRVTIAVVGILIGLLFLFVGLRSFETQPTDSGPDDTLVIPPATAGSN